MDLFKRDYHGYSSVPDGEVKFSVDEQEAGSADQPPKRHHSRKVYIVCLGLVYTALIVVTTWATTRCWDLKQMNSDKEWIWPAVAPAVEHQDTPEYAADHGRQTVFSGEPSAEQYDAWVKLAAPAFLRVSPEEVRDGLDDPTDSVKLADSEDDSLGILGVYHELHCLRRIRMWLHKEHYYGSEEAAAYSSYELHHLDRCIESIRISTMCQPNLSMYSYRWMEGHRKPEPVSTSRRSCVNWDRLDRWASERTVGPSPLLKTSENATLARAIEKMRVEHPNESVHYGRDIL